MSKSVTLPPKPTHMHPAVYSKIENDPTVDTAIRRDAILTCNSCVKEFGPEDDSSVEKRFNDFSNSKLDTGTPYGAATGDCFGHVKVLKDWIVRIHRTTGDSFSIVDKNLRILCGLDRASTHQQRLLAQDWALRRFLGGGDPSKELSLTGPVCFIFLPDQNGSIDDMFKHHPETLPCRLGLPSFWDEVWGSGPPAGTTQEYVGYVLIGEKLSKIRNVTVFHPGYRSVRDLWEPGGKTKPHPSGPKDHIALGGINELVCGQARASAAKGEVFGFEVKY